MSLFEGGVRVHVVGVGGAGMSALARLLQERGCRVSGSDDRDSPTLASLARAGVAVAVGHDPGHGEDATVVTWSPAVDADNVELRAAQRRGARLVPRAEALAQLARDQATVGLAGTHGKTTATSMMAMVMARAGRDPSRLVGAEVRDLGPGGHWGPGGLILEVDESYGTFELLEPAALGLLNVELDHLDFYGTPDALEGAFAALLDRTRGPVVAVDEPGARRVAARAHREVTWVSESPLAGQWLVSHVVLERHGSRFELSGPAELHVALSVTGRHNVIDAALVGALAVADGVDPRDVERGLADFRGAPRRFEFHGRWRGADVYEDYAHLPGEVASALAGARAAGYRDVTAVFQPHRFTRTRRLADEFADAFVDAARLVVMDVYGAGEPDPGDVDGRRVLDAVRRAHRDALVEYAPTGDDVLAVLAREDVGDAVVFLGAGDVGDLAPLIARSGS